jgi:hypothetical protein
VSKPLHAGGEEAMADPAQNTHTLTQLFKVPKWRRRRQCAELERPSRYCHSIPAHIYGSPFRHANQPITAVAPVIPCSWPAKAAGSPISPDLVRGHH